MSKLLFLTVFLLLGFVAGVVNVMRAAGLARSRAQGSRRGAAASFIAAMVVFRVIYFFVPLMFAAATEFALAALTA